jgi:hypothetical protein
MPYGPIRLADIEAKHAEAWRLHYVEDRSFSEVATIMNTTRSAIASYVRKHKEANGITVGRDPHKNVKRKRKPKPVFVVPIRVEFKFSYAIQAYREPDGVSLMDLQDYQCSYIVRSQGRSHWYCAEPTTKRHGGYCAHHAKGMKQ